MAIRLIALCDENITITGNMKLLLERQFFKLQQWNKTNSVELTSLVKIALNIQQQITIAAWAITYANDREAARREFNVALQPSTVGKWRKRLLETGRMQKIKPPGRPRNSTDAETTERIVEAFDASPQKSTRQAARELRISQSSVSCFEA